MALLGVIHRVAAHIGVRRQTATLPGQQGARPGDPVLDASGAAIGTVTSAGSTRAIASIKRGHTIGQPPAHLASPA